MERPCDVQVISRHPFVICAEILWADYGLCEIWKSLGRPKWFLVDLWPRQMPLICIADPMIAEQLTRGTVKQPESMHKMKAPEGLQCLLGKTSVSTAEVRVAPSVNARTDLFTS